VRGQGLTPDEQAIIAGYNLLTGKPTLIVLNVDEGSDGRRQVAAIEERFGGPGVAVVAVAARAEADLAELEADEAAAFREEMGLTGEPAAAAVMQAAVTLLGLISFFTAGPQDTHAWSIAAGNTVQKAAGRIHSDIERGFIRAEVIGWQELLDCGSTVEAKKRGLLRVEGKSYIVQDGDVINVLFNV
jgi:ribosome-binding ATPase YchF (GTP1/OBG family)